MLMLLHPRRPFLGRAQNEPSASRPPEEHSRRRVPSHRGRYSVAKLGHHLFENRIVAITSLSDTWNSVALETNQSSAGSLSFPYLGATPERRCLRVSGSYTSSLKGVHRRTQHQVPPLRSLRSAPVGMTKVWR